MAFAAVVAQAALIVDRPTIQNIAYRGAYLPATDGFWTSVPSLFLMDHTSRPSSCHSMDFTKSISQICCKISQFNTGQHAEEANGLFNKLSVGQLLGMTALFSGAFTLDSGI